MCIGAVAELNSDESQLSGANRDDDYINVDFSLFAELKDGRRVQTSAVYSEGGERVGWGVADGRRADLPLSRASIEEMLKLTIGPAAPHQDVSQGVIRRLEKAGARVSIAELLAAPFRLEIEPDLDNALTA